MDSQDEDLSDLLEYTFQISFKKLVKIIKSKSEVIKELQRDIRELRISMAAMTEKRDTLENSLAECQEECEQVKVRI